MMKDENRDWNREKGKTNSPSRGPEPKTAKAFHETLEGPAQLWHDEILPHPGP